MEGYGWGRCFFSLSSFLLLRFVPSLETGRALLRKDERGEEAWHPLPFGISIRNPELHPEGSTDVQTAWKERKIVGLRPSWRGYPTSRHDFDRSHRTGFGMCAWKNLPSPPFSAVVFFPNLRWARVHVLLWRDGWGLPRRFAPLAGRNAATHAGGVLMLVRSSENAWLLRRASLSVEFSVCWRIGSFGVLAPSCARCP